MGILTQFQSILILLILILLQLRQNISQLSRIRILYRFHLPLLFQQFFFQFPLCLIVVILFLSNLFHNSLDVHVLVEGFLFFWVHWDQARRRSLLKIILSKLPLTFLHSWLILIINLWLMWVNNWITLDDVVSWRLKIIKKWLTKWIFHSSLSRASKWVIKQTLQLFLDFIFRFKVKLLFNLFPNQLSLILVPIIKL